MGKMYGVIRYSFPKIHPRNESSAGCLISILQSETNFISVAKCSAPALKCPIPCAKCKRTIYFGRLRLSHFQSLSASEGHTAALRWCSGSDRTNSSARSINRSRRGGFIGNKVLVATSLFGSSTDSAMLQIAREDCCWISNNAGLETPRSSPKPPIACQIVPFVPIGANLPIL